MLHKPATLNLAVQIALVQGGTVSQAQTLIKAVSNGRVR